MKRYFLIIFALFLLTSPRTVLAKSNFKDVRVLAKDQIINSDYFAGGDVVEIYGTVNGDVYAAGGTVLIDGLVNGDLIAAGGTVTISGEVLHNVRVAGGQITFSGNVGRNITVLGGNIEFTDASTIGGSVTTLGGNVNVNAPLGKGLVAGVGNLVIGNTVGGNIEAAVGNLRLTPNAKVAGSLNYTSEEEISVSDTASVAGEINRRQTPEFMKKDYDEEWEKAAGGFSLFIKLSSLVTTLAIGLLAIKFLPNLMTKGTEIFLSSFLKSTTYGFIALIVSVIAVVLLFLSIVGIPLALVGSFILFIAFYLSRVYGMLAIGNFLSRKTNIKTSNYGIFALGLVVYYALNMLPIIGGLFTFVIGLASFGAALANKKLAWQASQKAKII